MKNKMISKNLENLMKETKESSLCSYCKRFNQGLWDEIADNIEEKQKKNGKIVFLIHNDRVDMNNKDCNRVKFLDIGEESSERGYKDGKAEHKINFLSEDLCRVYVCSKFSPLENVPIDIKEKVFMGALEKSWRLKLDMKYMKEAFENYLGKKL